MFLMSTQRQRITKRVELLPHQFDALTAKDQITLLKGGIGSGKSYGGALHCVDMIKTNPHSPGLIGANSYKQLSDATLRTLFGVLEEFKIRYRYNAQKNILYAGPKMFWCRSMENYDDLRGIEIGDFWLDETRDTKEEAFKVLLGRVRHPRANRFRGLCTTSPSGFNWLHDYFVVNRRPGFGMVEASSMDNHHLPAHYIESLMSSYDSKMIRQEVYGEFINLVADAVYYSFDRTKNVRAFEPLDLPLRIGMDFNVNPMTAVIGWVTHDTIYIWDEAFLTDSNTYKMSEHLIAEGYGHCDVIPDGTGKALKTSSAGVSDHIILEQYGFDVLASTNPFAVDRHNCVNGLLEKARIVIHPRCVRLIKDLEQVSRGKNDPMLTHISDALGYLAWWSFPIRKERPLKQYSYV